MGANRRMETPLSPEVQRAIREVLEQTYRSPTQILDASSAASALARLIPAAAAIGIDALRDEIVREATQDGRLGIAFLPART